MSGTTCLLDGPTGERNSYSLVGRNRVLCLAESDSDRLIQLAAALAVGSAVCWVAGENTAGLRARLPKGIQSHISLIDTIDATDGEGACFDVALHHGDPDQLRTIRQQLAQRPGAIVTVHGWSHGDTAIALDCLLLERVLSINTAASGGNASLMSIG